MTRGWPVTRFWMLEPVCRLAGQWDTSNGELTRKDGEQ